MKEFKISKSEGELEIGSIRIVDLFQDPDKVINLREGVTKQEFFDVLDKASQPIEKPKSDSEKQET